MLASSLGLSDPHNRTVELHWKKLKKEKQWSRLHFEEVHYAIFGSKILC
jgi:hypothetical protein